MIIGKEFIGTSAGAIIIDPITKKIFMSRRSSGARDDQGLWEFPGGSIELFESRENASKRNIKRKHDIEIQIKEVLGVYDVIDKEGQQDHWVSTTYICEKVSGDEKIMQLDKCDQIGWFSISEIQGMNISRISKLNLADVLKLNIY